jgi:hypothetical protein
MSILSWNCRGLGNPCIVQKLAHLVWAKDPSAVFLCETWSNDEHLEHLRCRLHFNNKLLVLSNKKGGGLALFWNKSFDLSVLSYSCNHIDTVVHSGTSDAWRLTFVYGALETHRRIETWNLIRRLSQQHHLPWCCIGDFNEIVLSSEMQGRRPRPERQMKDFREVLDECGMMDLGYRGSPFTWCNNRDPPNTTWVRLDRGVASLSWLHKFQNARLEHLNVTNSDHKCLHLELEPCNQPQYLRKPFRFEEIWTTDAGCEDTIQAEWDKVGAGMAMFQVWNKLKDCKRGLGKWSKQHFGNVTQQLAEKRQQLLDAETNAIQGGVWID